jgi:hypothetical protein
MYKTFFCLKKFQEVSKKKKNDSFKDQMATLLILFFRLNFLNGTECLLIILNITCRFQEKSVKTSRS